MVKERKTRTPRRRFTYEEALVLFPEVEQRTAAAASAVDQLLGEVEESESSASDAYQRIVSEWAEVMLAFGLEVKGLWLVDFDSGAGFYCWRYPEPSIAFFHGYDEDFSGRVRLN